MNGSTSPIPPGKSVVVSWPTRCRTVAMDKELNAKHCNVFKGLLCRMRLEERLPERLVPLVRRLVRRRISRHWLYHLQQTVA